MLSFLVIYLPVLFSVELIIIYRFNIHLVLGFLVLSQEMAIMAPDVVLQFYFFLSSIHYVASFKVGEKIIQ